MLSSLEIKIFSVGEGVQTREPLYVAGGNVNAYSHTETSMEADKKLKENYYIRFSNPMYGSFEG